MKIPLLRGNPVKVIVSQEKGRDDAATQQIDLPSFQIDSVVSTRSVEIFRTVQVEANDGLDRPPKKKFPRAEVMEGRQPEVEAGAAVGAAIVSGIHKLHLGEVEDAVVTVDRHTQVVVATVVHHRVTVTPPNDQVDGTRQEEVVVTVAVVEIAVQPLHRVALVQDHTVLCVDPPGSNR